MFYFQEKGTQAYLLKLLVCICFRLLDLLNLSTHSVIYILLNKPFRLDFANQFKPWFKKVRFIFDIQNLKRKVTFRIFFLSVCPVCCGKHFGVPFGEYLGVHSGWQRWGNYWGPYGGIHWRCMSF